MEHNGNSNGPKDSKPEDNSDSISPLSGDINSVNKNDVGTNTDCGTSNIEDGDIPTPMPDDERENAKKLAEFVRKVLHNEEIPDDKMNSSPLCLLIEFEQSVEVSQEELKNMILNKYTKVMTTHSQSHIANQMSNITEVKRQQRLYYKKCKELCEYIKSTKSELDLLVRVPKNEVEHVRNVGINVKMPEESRKRKTL